MIRQKKSVMSISSTGHYLLSLKYFSPTAISHYTEITLFQHMHLNLSAGPYVPLRQCQIKHMH